MATLNGIELGNNTRWVNEFEGSAKENTEKWTEDGRLFVFQRKKNKFKAIEYDCDWQTYAIVKQLAAIRDSGEVVILIHNDSREFNVIINSIEAVPIRATTYHPENAKFNVKLELIEV